MDQRYDLITGIIGSRGAESEDVRADVENKKPSILPMKECNNSPRIPMSTNKLISILAENSSGAEGSTRKPICIEPKPPRIRRETAAPVANILQVHLQRGNCNVAGTAGSIAAKYGACGSSAGKQKIPRPANAFMLFANEWRKKLAIQNPRESNKDISVRLGVLWKNMAKGIKEKYFALAREVDAEHKRKYPDYVYNPKEARLRKAMREQSRELSRQSILQTAIASAAGTAGNVSTSGVVTSSSFLNHPMTCSSSSGSVSGSAAGVSSMPNSPSVNNNGRIINPWFPVGPTSSSTHLKPIISPRIMAAHQRTLEKTKELAMRKQVQECAAAAGVFSSGSNNQSVNSAYGGDFSSHNNPPPNPNDYCIIAEFGDGQKWHPYQNGGNPYHGRGSAMSKVGLHPNPNIHGPWAQFCGLPLQASAPTSSAAASAQNPVIRPPRQMVFLQEQQQAQHCTFSDEMQMAYAQNKIDVNHRLHPAYNGQGDPQIKTSASPPQMQQLQDEIKCNEVSQGWDSGAVVSSGTGVNSLLQEQVSQEQDEDVLQTDGNDELLRQKSMNSKQPLPGFHQAFGSTEIGRFSRSEFFANMVGENCSNVSISNGPHQNVQGYHGELKNRSGTAGTNFFNLQNNGGPGSTGTGATGNFGNLSNFGNVALAAYYNEIRSPGTPAVTNPRWHSPYVGTISEAYLPAPVYPFSPTTHNQNVLGTPTMSSVADEDLFQMMPEDCYWLGGTPSPFSHNQNIENATVLGFSLISPNYAAFLDYSHRLTMSQEWLHQGSTAQELQAAFIEQPSLFHDNNSIFGHEHLTYGNYPCLQQPAGYDHQNRQTPINNGISEGNLNELIEANEQSMQANSQKQSSVVMKQNDRICVMLDANHQAPQIEKDI